MSARDEVRAGDLGEEFVRLLYRTVAVVARAHNFPAPAAHGSWNVEAVMETAHDFLVSPKADRRLIELASMAGDDPAFERLLSTAVLNHLREGGRRTVVGKLMRRLRGLLENDDRFAFVGERRPGAGNVVLADAEEPGDPTTGATDPFAGSRADLLRAAYEVRDVSVTRWSPLARREGPIGDADSLLEVCAAVLGEAGGSLRLADLAEVVAVRFGVDPSSVPATLSVDDVDALDVSASDRVGIGSHSELVVSDDIAALLEPLSDREMLVLACLQDPVRTIADRTGLAASSAGSIKQRLVRRLRASVTGSTEAEADALVLGAIDAARQILGIDHR